jgi:hypothetical protein
MRTTRVFAAIAAVVLAAPLVLAGDDLIIALKYIPTTKPGQVRAELRDGIPNKGVAIAIDDVRAVKTKDIVGEGTGNGDDTFRIRSAGFMPSFMSKTLKDRFSTWGVQFEDTSNLVLIVKITRYYVHETHAFLNSTFTAEVQLPWSLADRAGHVYAEGTAMGTGKTKGRWRNPVNCEEVLSNSLEQAAATILSDAKLQEAWLTANPQPAPAGVAAAPTPALAKVAMMTGDGRVVRDPGHKGYAKTPAQLLTEVNKLRRQQLGTDVMVAYVSKQTLATGFTADDLVAWKRAGVPERVTREAVRRAP